MEEEEEVGPAGQVEGLLLGVQAVGGSLLFVGQEKLESPIAGLGCNHSSALMFPAALLPPKPDQVWCL